MGEVLIKIQPPDHPVHMPEPAVFSTEVESEIDRHLAKYPVKRSAILPLMFIVQRERGYLDPPGVQYLANRLQLRVTDIWEVATFYSMIQTKPVGRYHIQVCKTLSCKLLGADKITKKNLIRVPLIENTLPHQLIGRFGAGRVMMKPASEGTGVIAGGAVRAVMR